MLIKNIFSRVEKCDEFVKFLIRRVKSFWKIPIIIIISINDNSYFDVYVLGIKKGFCIEKNSRFKSPLNFLKI
jgi:hypothetical protein